MSSRYSQIRIAMDIFQEVPQFAPAGQKGDQFEQHICFEGDLRVPVPNFTSPPRVIITPVDADSGFVGLQTHTGNVAFANVRIKTT